MEGAKKGRGELRAKSVLRSFFAFVGFVGVWVGLERPRICTDAHGFCWEGFGL